MYKKILAVMMLIACIWCVKANALSARSAVVVDAQVGRIVYEKDAHTRRPMASTTKIMTALVAIESGKLNDIITVSPTAANVEGSSIWLAPGEKMKMSDMLYGLMLSSGNDAATAIAEHVAGSVPKFAELMNEKAISMGLKNTSFDNPHGLSSPNHYTTAYELALITCEALNNPLFAQIVSTKKQTIPWEGKEWGRTLANHNKLLRLYQGADGVKTGFTKDSGRTLVSSATRNNIKLVAATLNASDDWNDHIFLLDYGFERCKTNSVISAGTPAVEIPVHNGVSEFVSTEYSADVDFTSVHDEKAEVLFDVEKTLFAPVAKGQRVGTVIVKYKDKIIGESTIITSNDVQIIPKPGLLDTINNIFTRLLTLLQ